MSYDHIKTEQIKFDGALYEAVQAIVERRVDFNELFGDLAFMGFASYPPEWEKLRKRIEDAVWDSLEMRLKK